MTSAQKLEENGKKEFYLANNGHKTDPPYENEALLPLLREYWWVETVAHFAIWWPII